MSRILVCEDSIIVNQHISKTLEVAGYEVHAAFTGSEGVEKATEILPDLILMDIMMETQDDGIVAAMEIKKALDLPVIFLTALTDDGTLDRVKESEPYGYIIKPFNEVELLSNIKVALHKSKAENIVKNNRDLLQASINSIDQAFLLIDQSKAITYANRFTEALTGLSFDQMIGKPFDQILTILDESDQLLDISELEKLDKETELILQTKDSKIDIGELVLTKVKLRQGECSLLVFRNISDRVKARRLEAELEKKRIASLIEGQENERNRLSREIHDGIGQMVNLIKLNVTSLPDGDQKEKLKELLIQTLTEVRNVSENLHPSRLKDFSLEKNVEKLMRQLDGSEIDFQFNSSDVPELPFYKKTHLYRIIQEALSNIVKHSEANESTIQLNGLNGQVQLTIEDDGIGYDPKLIDETEAHHGLQNIKFRVNSMNGKFVLESNPTTGTMLLITVPAD